MIFVNDVVKKAVMDEQVFYFIYVVAGSFFGACLGVSYFVIARNSNYFHIWHAAMAYLYGNSVKYFMGVAMR